MAIKNNKADTPSTSGLSGKIHAFGEYLDEAKVELKKTTWPTKKEVKVTTFAVLILVTIMSIFLGLADFALVKIINAITSIGI